MNQHWLDELCLVKNFEHRSKKHEPTDRTNYSYYYPPSDYSSEYTRLVIHRFTRKQVVKYFMISVTICI